MNRIIKQKTIAVNDNQFKKNNKLLEENLSRNFRHNFSNNQDDTSSDFDSNNNNNKLMDNLAESIEYLSRISPTTMPEWMD